MALVKYEPLNLLSRMQNELNAFFRHGDTDFPSLFDDRQMLIGSEWMPRIDIKEDDSHYTVTADIPGVDPKDIKVAMENGMLSIKGERSFRMPDTADSGKITAKGKNGVLTVQIGKKEAARPKTIKIESE